MLTALLVAASQPATLDGAMAPRSGSYGWIEQLSGSCFATERFHRRIRTGRDTKCFATRDGRFVITTIDWHPRYEYWTECVLASAQEGVLRFDCTRQGAPHINLIARYDSDAFVTQSDSARLAGHQRLNRQRTAWRRIGDDALSMTVEELDPRGSWRASAMSEPRVLARVRP